jgi:CBS domain containing-hemolysin-like protein
MLSSAAASFRISSPKGEGVILAVFSPESEMHWIWSVLGLAAIPALVALNGFFVAAEFALVGVRRTRLEELVKQGVSGAKAAEEAVIHLDRTIAVTQLGITLASIALGWVGEPALASLVTPVIELLVPTKWAAAMAHSVAVAIAFTLITFLHVVFGELIPKTMALQSPDKTSLWVAAPLNIFTRLSNPVVAVMNSTGNFILRLAGYATAGTESDVHSVDELALLVEDTQEAGGLSPQQAELVRKVFRLSGKKVGDCMVPRERMAALDLSTPSDKVLEIVRQGAHTRMPVYEGELDHIVGVVNTKDLFYLFSLRGIVVLEDALYPALFLKPEADVGDALELFRKGRRPFAVVRDADNKVLGIITMEDVLEEIVGELEDEHDRPTPKLRLGRRSPGIRAPRKN